MKTATARKIIGCIGKCTSGLTIEELDELTDTVHKTLNRQQGKQIFRQFLRKGKRQDDLKCLDFHDQCCRYIQKEQDYVETTKSPNLKMLTNDVSEAFDTAAELDNVPEIDMALLDMFNDALNAPCRDAMLRVLEEAKLRLEDHLIGAHKDFRSYMQEPCPNTR